MHPIHQLARSELLLDLLFIAVRRPSRQCLNYKILYIQARRNASTDVKSDSSSKPKIPPTVGLKTSTSAPAAAGSNVSMRMLLDRNPENRSAISRIPIPRGERGEKFIPQPLARPLGLPYPPEPGQNTPVDQRSWSEKKADFTDHDNAMTRRRVLLRTYLRPYFQEWRRVDHLKRNSIKKNERLFKLNKALWFPNMWGQTLRKEGDGPDGGTDSTRVLQGKVSIVTIQSGLWAEEQIATFLGGEEGQNPALKSLIDGSKGLVQRVDVNIQSDWVRSLIVKLFKGRLRKSMPETQWGKYFMVKLARDVGTGLTEEIRDAMGLLNSQVGYVYLLDTECRIRWAGSGHAWKGEVDSLNSGIRRLVELTRMRRSVERELPVSSATSADPERERQLEKATA